MTKNTRDLPLNRSKEEFKKYVKPKELFSKFEPVEGERISPVEQ
jgi:hypothetical protein